MLGQLNVKPRTEYLARVRNTHRRLMTAQQLSDLEKYQSHDDHGHGSDDHDEQGHDDHGHEENHSDEPAHASESPQE
jgi:hypothetical protein